MRVASFSEIQTEFIKRVHQGVWCNLATLDTRNRLRSRVLRSMWEGSTGWIPTMRQSLKAKHVAHHPYVSLAYVTDVFQPVYVDCTAEWEDQPAVRRRIWELFQAAPPPLGFDPGKVFGSPANPDFGLLKLTPWRIELYDRKDPQNHRVWRR